MSRTGNRRGRVLLKEAIRGLVAEEAEEQVSRMLSRVRVDEETLYQLEEGRWDRLKGKLAAAGLAISCTATGCGPVVSATGEPADPTEFGISASELPPGEYDFEFEDETSGVAGRPKVDTGTRANALGGSIQTNRAGRMGRDKLNPRR